jgi:site-specific DNA-cytosine methylase
VDYLHASPSCKNYSSANCKIEDPIDLMTAEATARAIRDIRPPLFTLENVPAYQKREAFQRIADELSNQGYNWDVVQHNAADLGAPSSRNRMMVRASLGDLPPAQQYWPKPGDWFPAIEDQLESMRPSQLAPWQLMRLAERGIDPTSLDTPLLVGGGSGFKGDIPLAFAGRPGITVLSSPVQTDRVVLPGGDVRALNPRSYARLLGLSDSYPLPDDRNLAKIIVGNGMAPAMTREVVEPLLNQRLINMVEKYK